ncbi:DNA mismatch repair endonuclease MutL [Loigolactobacillus bifermentans]|uniref:DNA mismatch repair protein MutL n=1 Tax=Loigolactobacillus bifermentans DSM 20003 TaxID=1423726 RepID=A0A0R1H9A6_9LACO|nr:DNA mismatch repair endonuclease MutL [Loigolactobacillus bifermentans]KRK40226.1 DNA mismatch repair protein [Loigolactobacillus bifermentans DSM 20003]QGG61699.1 DNA mismatch repair endonuclease MutL [Loigolactobacillus bifermentans]
MAQIHELAEVLANQIAAGEVIERPASVVKELVENALDAGSTQVDVLVTGAGLTSIQVIDNGGGIAPEDVEIAFRRHATSKISSRQDLFKVHSLGFRGEALPSIASVADVVLETATDSAAGVRVHYRGGKLLEHATTALRPGTTVTVTDLFYNTPARLKYVKSPHTELGQIGDIINRLALSHPDVAFSLASEGNILVRTTGNGGLQQTIAGIYGVKLARKMLAIQAEDLDFKLQGFVSLPELTRSARRYLTVLINGRYIKNFQLNKAIIAGYGSKLMVGRYPIAVIAIEMDPILVDVNVHPTKQEVRLSKEEELGKLLETTIFKRIAQENLIPDAQENLNHATRSKTTAKPNQLTMALNNASQKWTEQVVPVTRQAPAKIAEPEPAPFVPQNGVTTDTDPTKDLIFDDPQRLAQWDQRYQAEQPGPIFDEPAPVAHPTAAPQPTGPRFPTLDYIGQLHGTYLLAGGADGFYIIDQHAAQERVNYEHYRQAIGEVSHDQQNLLVPLVLDYPASDAVRIRAQQDLFAQIGLVLASFGQNSFILRAHPTWFKAGQEEDTAKEMIDYVLDDQKLDIAKFREKTAIMMSCKRAIKANHHLDEQQAKALLQRLPQCENPFNCPHGRPVVVHFTQTDLEKMFKRIQDQHESLRGAE